MRLSMIVPAVVLTVAATPGVVFSQGPTAPETFTANLQVAGANAGAAAATITIDVQRYSPDAEREAVASALKTGGYPAFLTALRKASQVGTVGIGDKKWAIRWARQQPANKGRNIVLVVDQPMYFVGGGAADAKPREGYEVAVIQLQVYDAGIGNGTMAAAARVKPGGETGVQIDDYAEKPIKIVSVVRQIK
jgi:hypothetical protein